MVVDRQPFSPTARIVASILASVCLTTGSIGLIVAITRARWVLALAALGVLGLGVLYAGAAWRGRPWPWRLRR